MTLFQTQSHSQKPTVAVLGAGIVGVTSALALVESGFHVVLVDQLDDVSQATSKSNGAQLSYGYADAMAAPGLIAMAGRILLGQEAGLKFRLKPTPHNLSWLISFLREGTANRFIANTRSSLEIALRSKAQMDIWQNRYHFDFDHQVSGKLQILPDQASIEGQKPLIDLKRTMGIRQSVLTPGEAVEVEPALGCFGGEMAGALYSPDEEVGDPQRFARAALDLILTASPNNRFLRSHEVTSVDVRNGAIRALKTNRGDIEADAFVFAAGQWSSRFAKQLGIRLSIVPVAGYSLTYRLGANAPKHSVTDIKAKAVLCPLGDKLRIAGLADIGYDAASVAPARIEQLRSVLTKRFPGLAAMDGDGEPWVGHRPVTPNSQPIVSKTALLNGFVNCGHGTLGWTMAAATAVELASKVCAQFGMADSRQEITSEVKPANSANPSGADLVASA
ncbi:FAD-dependent oxidoreductase [Maritalea porphyrae]|jgi:D-amino-acid dehydrogenase|uniref:FAD-dependent oxidoreductase n=1 Tax=Maritalea porphyrae TaxID=880732 RepID=UPI0022AF231B|nr:FAD-dependent oxidoreductase [Maritalea porphyrae]MCZ4272505.1 FAD-dependent oxidoreductase [Maritalea porphyrae]